MNKEVKKLALQRWWVNANGWSANRCWICVRVRERCHLRTLLLNLLLWSLSVGLTSIVNMIMTVTTSIRSGRRT